MSLAERPATRTLDPAAVPADWADVTPEWMTAALAERFPGAVVDDVGPAMRDDGTNRRARFALGYAAGEGPTSVFCKAGGGGEHREVHARNGTLFIEADLFASGTPLPVDHPQVYRVVIDRPGLDFVLVMEDLTARGADPRDATRPMSVDQVANGLRSLARMHGRYWGFSAATHPQLAWVQTWEPTEGWQVGLRSRVPIGLERAAGRLPDSVAARDGNAIVDLWARFVATLSREPVTLLHGDAHIGNTYVLPDGGVGFLDWQVAHRGGWEQDVAYFLVGALTTEDRRRHEADLVAEYRQALPEAVRPSAGEAWLRYRACAAYGLAIWLSTLGTDGWQSRDVCLALAERYAAAFDELEAVAALERLETR